MPNKSNSLPKVCIVVLNYQTYQLTISYVNKLLSQSFLDIEVVVVDNASPNGSYTYLEEEFTHNKKVKLILSSENGGYSYGNNRGLEYSFGRNYDFIFISNNDVIWKNQDDLSNLIHHYENGAKDFGKVAFFSAQMKDSNGVAFPAWKIPSVYYDIAMFFPFVNRYFEKSFSYKLPKNGISEVEVIPGSFFGAEAATFKNIGLLDENIFLYCEERLLAKKIKNMSLNNIIISNVNYVHDSSSTIDTVLSKKNKMKAVFKSVNYYHSCHSKRKNISRVILKLLQKVYLMIL